MLREQGITIREALQIEPFNTSNLIAGEKGIDNTIAKLNILADYEGINWVSEGELLLTTMLALNVAGDAMQADGEEADGSIEGNFILELHKKGLAGIAIKSNSANRPISPKLIEAANKYGFPLIEIDPDIPFSEITVGISSHIFNRQATIIMKLEKTHNHLMDIVITGGGLNDIAKTIFLTTGNPVLIKDNIFGGLEGEDGIPENQLIAKSLKPIIYREEQLTNIFNNHLKKTLESTDNVDGKMVNRLTVPIRAANNIYGYIMLWEINKPVSNLDLRILETSSTVIALEIVKRMSVYQVESRYKMEFLENLLSRDITMQNLAYERSALMGWNEKDSYVVMVINVESSELDRAEQAKRGLAHVASVPAKDIFKSYKTGIIEEIESIAKLEKEKIFIGEKSDSLILLLCVGENPTEAEAYAKCNKMAEKIIKEVDTKYYKAKLSIGIGRYYQDVRKLWKSYQEARNAIIFGNIHTKKNIVNFESLGIYKLLSNENIDSELLAFYKSTIYPLVEYDKRKNTEFIPTLQAYFETNGNLKKMADLLYTHYNTILYRLQRMQQVAKINLKSPEDRLNIEIGLKIMNVMEGRNTKEL